jgi:phosphoglycerate dehydrogenase-like enzyme
MDRPVCVLWVDDDKPYRQSLAAAGIADRFELQWVKRDEPMPEELAARAQVLVGWRPGGYLAQMTRLEWIQSMTAGVESWLASPALRADVMLSCARGAHRLSMPENILGALFHLTKPYMAVAEAQRESRWTRKRCIPLNGKTLGILGLGAVGQDLARKAAALDMRVIGVKRSPAPVPHVERVYAPEQMDEVLGAADFVVLLMPSTPQTDNIMNAERLRAMKPTAWLLNFGRGSLVHDDDLIAAVRAKTIAGAVLDVFREEPLPSSHRFWTTDNILVLPHIGGGHPERNAHVAELFAANAKRHFAGEPLETLVDRARGY